jgi:hypothetical protein
MSSERSLPLRRRRCDNDVDARSRIRRLPDPAPSFTTNATDGGTTLTKSAEFLDRSFLAKVTSWKISRDVPAGLESDVKKIRARLESPSSSS